MGQTAEHDGPTDADLLARVTAIEDSIGGCGQVYEIFEERVRGRVAAEARRLGPDGARFVAIAESRYGGNLMNPPRRRADGACEHHLDPGCCPLGCGDRDE